MALIFNGTTVPTNVANALIYNGTSITNVVFNSTTVWTQSLFQAQWSGSSQSSGYFTMSTSGNLLRYVTPHYTGAWITTNMNGTFTGNSLVYNGNMGFITSSNLLRFRFYDYANGWADTANWCTFTIANKWTGKTWWHYYGYVDPNNPYTLETGGGLIRAIVGTTAGSWISLT